MKKFIAIALFAGLFQYTDGFSSFSFGTPDYASARNEVVLYATSWCGYCQKTRELFQANGIPYIEYDIERSEKANAEFKKLGGGGVPLVQANGKVIRGYAPEAILAAMRSK